MKRICTKELVSRVFKNLKSQKKNILLINSGLINVIADPKKNSNKIASDPFFININKNLFLTIPKSTYEDY